MSKAFGRGLVNIKGAIIDMSQDIDALMDDTPLEIIIGGGLNLGLKYVYADQFTLGFTADDLMSPSGILHYNLPSGDDSSDLTLDSTEFDFFAIRPRVNIGAAYQIKPWDFLRVAFMADYRDLLNIFIHDYSTKNPILNISLGAEAKFYNIIVLRAGMNEMLPALGLGFDFKIVRIDFAYYGKELSNEPGNLSTYALDFGLLFKY
jgi:hypothetical protein